MKNILLFLVLGILVIPSVSSKNDHSVEFLNSKSRDNSLPFSEGVRVGNLIFLSGQIGIDPETNKLAVGGIQSEAKQTMNNIKSTLADMGYSMKDLVKCTVMLADISEWQSFNEVYVTFFSQPYPARSAFGANGLALNSRVEVECIAAINS